MRLSSRALECHLCKACGFLHDGLASRHCNTGQSYNRDGNGSTKRRARLRGSPLQANDATGGRFAVSCPDSKSSTLLTFTSDSAFALVIYTRRCSPGCPCVLSSRFTPQVCDITMSIGSLSARIELDDPSRVHYGSTDPVTGTIVLCYRPGAKATTTSSTELFGRLVLDITFHGRTESKILRSNGQFTTIHRGRVHLFSSTHPIYNDVLRTPPGEWHHLPFELFFPSVVEATAYLSERPAGQSWRQGDWKENPSFARLKKGLDLPPSVWRPQSTFGSFETFVEYRIGCAMRMEGLKVDIRTPGRDNEPYVRYESPRLNLNSITSQPRTIRGVMTVSNKELLPESSRPSGLKEKTKATLSSNYYPTYAFDWTIHAPQDIFSRSPVNIIVTIDPRDPVTKRQDFVVPIVHFTQCTLEIKSLTACRTEAKPIGPFEQHADGSTTEKTLVGQPDLAGPFCGDNGWQKVFTFEPVVLPSSFRFVNVRLDYKIKLRGVFQVAGRSETVSDSWPITIYPPLGRGLSSLDGPLSGSGVTGPSFRGSSSKASSSGDTGRPDLSKQEQPPVYSAAVDSPPAFPKDKGSHDKTGWLFMK